MVVPLVMAACQVSPQVDDAVVASLSFQFGKICCQLAGELQRWFHPPGRAQATVVPRHGAVHLLPIEIPCL